MGPTAPPIPVCAGTGARTSGALPCLLVKALLPLNKAIRPRLASAEDSESASTTPTKRQMWSCTIRGPGMAGR